MIVPTAEVVRLVITTAEGILRPAIVILAATGIRRGELVGLRWSDIDGHSITVRRAVTEAGGVGTKATKTRRGRRSVTVGQPVIDELAAWQGDVWSFGESATLTISEYADKEVLNALSKLLLYFGEKTGIDPREAQGDRLSDRTHSENLS
jgi:integrase